ncbi:SusC/RagA family TonB-linked outer membrane protein [Pedobacter sp. PACM 27299]|uniref:SusC/RagA family TonB-linked outer membrane protein n=1 Tax=Pedobacter sp. PACM 27299 TaxID=1727164 RepID=UPI000706695C|nr:SusC/RagA family TonB-linked outer membrane protein [Pedobacter sp. PACM 27299]ALL06951.1 SusC/RagA family TonB-linked outer membrane protein [Pedobacter sp. PACM 27299]
MKKPYITLFLGILFSCLVFFAKAQKKTVTDTTSSIADGLNKGIVELGLRTEKAWRNTASVFTISGEELTRMTSGNLLNTLQGRIPGLTIITGSGEPGYDNPTFYVRGQSSWNLGGGSVLIYLDGFQVDMGAITSLSAYEIESVTLLKDAVALAMYGMEGGSGVIMFKTKRGQEGPNKIIVNGRYGIQRAIQLPKVMNAYDYTRYYNQALTNDGLAVRYPNPELYKAGNDPLHPNVNWYDEVLKQNSVIQNYNLSFKGGNSKAKYFVFMDHTDFSGLYKNAKELDKDFGTNAQYRRENIRANLDLQMSKNLSVQASISGITEDKYTPAGFTATSLFNNMMRIPAAAFPVKNPNNSWGNGSAYDFNPVQLLKQNGIWSSHTRNIQTNFSFAEKLDAITPGLRFNGAVSYSNQYVGYYAKTFTVPSYEIRKDANDNPILDASGKITYSQRGVIGESISDGETSHWYRTILQAWFDYNRTFGKHTFTGKLLAKKQNYSHNGMVYPLRNQGISGNMTYDYDAKYIVDLSAGYTGSADFAEGQRYGLFPALGLGWIASQENFLKESKDIDFLKLRVSYGKTGNTNENYRFLYQQWVNSSSGFLFGDENKWYEGFAEGPFANPKASWEVKKIFNIGVDLQMFKKFSLNLDLFSEKRTGIIQIDQADVPDYTGFSLPYMNSGEVKNSGFEAVLAYNNQTPTFEYYVKGMLSFARNKIISISETTQPQDYLYRKGYAISQYRGLVSNGYYETSDFDADGKLLTTVVQSGYSNVKPGDLKYIDQDGNGIINDYDKKPINFSNIPELTLGFNFGFRYKGFDLDAFFQAVTNRTVILPQAYTTPFVNNNNITIFSENSWTPQNANGATSPRLSSLNSLNNTQSSDFWMRDGSFLKLRSLELGYTFPKRSIIRNMEMVRLFLNGTNIFTWDKIDHLEAENLSMGYPLMRSFSLGLKVKF